MRGSQECPREDGGFLVAGAGVLGESVCPTCNGRMLVTDIAERLLEELGLERETVVQLADSFGGKTLPCSACGQRLRPLALRGVPVHLCTGCGSLWFDEGGLARVSDGHHREVRADTQPTPAQRTEVAVLLGAREVSVDALVSAVRGTRLAGLDARQVAARGDGVVSLQLTQQDAELIVARLRIDGVAASAVPVTEVSLPATHDVQRLRPSPAELVGLDSLQREVRVPWTAVVGIGVGRFVQRGDSWRHTVEASRQRQAARRPHSVYAAGIHMAQATLAGLTRPGVGRGKREGHEDILLIIAEEGLESVRFRLSTALFDEPAIGLQRAPVFQRMLREIVDNTPQAAVTRAVRNFLRQDERVEVPAFDDEKGFERDLLWSVWRGREDRRAPPAS